LEESYSKAFYVHTKRGPTGMLCQLYHH